MTNPTLHPPPASAPWRWAGVAAMVVLVLGLPMLLKLGPPPRRPFDDKPLTVLRKDRPEIVLIGDSMLETRIDERALERVSGERCAVFAQPGSSSAVWFLMLKNFVAELQPPPRAVIVLFRSRQLTLPRHRAEGDYRKSMESYMSAAEPLIDRFAGTGERPGETWLERVIQQLYPGERRREQAQRKVQTKAMDLFTKSAEFEHLHNHAKYLFGPKRLRVGVTVDEQNEGGAMSLDPDDHEFSREVERSFLPAMLEIAQAHGIRLVFFEVKRRPRPDGRPGEESPTNAAYDEELGAYLKQAGAVLIDESDAAEITPDFYGSGDHVAAARMAEYTALFWQRVAAAIPAKEAAR